MPVIVNRLPKVTEYALNFGKSVSYAVMDELREETAPNIAGFIDDNQEVFANIASAAKNYRRTITLANRAIKRSKVYEAGGELKKNLMDSIRTGKFYDKERQNLANDKAGGSMTDMSDMDSDWGSNDQFDIDEDTDSMEAAEFRSADRVASAVEYTSRAQSQVIAKSTEYLAETNMASTRLLFSQGEKMHSTVMNGFAGVQAMMEQAHNFLDGPLTAHMTNSQHFYEKTQEQLNNIIGMLKESTEIQRNLYKKEVEQEKDSGLRKVGMTTPDLARYGKEVTKNLKEALGPEFSILFGNDMGDGNMLLTLVANPLQFIPDFFAKKLVPHTIKKSLESLDETVDGVFSNLMARLVKMGDSDNPVLSWIGRVFGLRPNEKRSVDPSKYEKGAVPFDGVTRKAIVDVIPGHLARIEAALTGASERVFDFETGKWTTFKEAKYQKDKREREKYRDAMPTRYLDDYVYELKKHNEELAAEFQKTADAVMKKAYEDGYFAPYQTFGHGDFKETAQDHYGVTDDREWKLLTDLLMADRKNAKRISSKIARDKEYRASRMREIEQNGQSADRIFYNNTYYNAYNDRHEIKDRHMATRDLIYDSVDEYNYNIFDYLREIRDNTAGRGNGGSGYSGNRKPAVPRRPRGGGGGATPTPANSGSSGGTTEPFDIDKYNRSWEDKLLVQEFERNGGIRENTEDAFLTKLLQAGSLGEKFKVFSEGLDGLLKKPGLMVAGVLDRADKRLFSLLFGDKDHVVTDVDIDDEDGKNIRGIFDYMIFRVKNTFDKMNDWLDENILDPLKNKLGVETIGDLLKLITDKLGITGPLETAKGWVRGMIDPVKQRLRDKFGWTFGQVKGALSNTYGGGFMRRMQDQYMINQGFMNANGEQAEAGIDTRFINQAVAQAPRSIDDFNDLLAASAIQQEINPGFDADALGYRARGGLITRRGLAVVSPGERIIPAGGRRTQRNMLAEEKAFARRHGLLNRVRNFFAGGNAAAATDTTTLNSEQPGGRKTSLDNSTDYDKVKATVQKVTEEVIGDKQHKGVANVIASGLIGGGVSLVTGLIGGPLLGAAVGSSFGILQNSNSVRRMLFGEEFTDENGDKQHKEGLISKKVQDAFKKYAPSMRDFGIAGAITGLFTPFGLVGGLMIGGAVGFATENEKVQDFLFGKKQRDGERDGGILKKELREKLKKAAPRMLAGSIGAAIFGPFGFLGNVALGSALGFATTTNEFHEAIFGKEVDDGQGGKKRYGGLVGQIKNGFAIPMVSFGKWLYQDAKVFTRKHLIAPLKDFGVAMRDAAFNGISNIANGVRDHINDMVERTIGRPLGEWFQHTIIEKLTRIALRLFKLPYTALKGAIALPSHALGAIGNNIRASQIARGTAHGMSAEQRLDFRRRHMGRMAVSSFLGKERSLGFDAMLTGMKGEQGVAQMKEMRDQIDEFLDNSSVGSKASKLINQCGAEIRDYLETTTMEDKNGLTVTLYYFLGSGIVKTIKKKIASGKVKDADDLMHLGKFMKVPPELKVPLVEIINKYLPQVNQAIEERKKMMADRKGAAARLKNISKGFMRDKRSIRAARGLLTDQIDYEEAALSEEAKKAEEEAKKGEDPTLSSIDVFRKMVGLKADDIIATLRSINTQLGGTNPGDEANAGSAKSNSPHGETEPAPKMGDENNDTPTTSTGQRKRIRLTGVAEYGPLRPEDQKISNQAQQVGEMISGKKQDILNMANNAANTIEDEETGEVGITDSNGNPLNRNARSILRRHKKKNEEEGEQKKLLGLTLFGKMKDKAAGLLKSGTGLIGGLLGWAGDKAGKGLGLLGKVAKIATGIALLGHLSGGFFEKVLPVLKDLGGKIMDGFEKFTKTAFPNLHDFLFGNDEKNITGVFKKISGFITDPLSAISNWYKTGFEKFKQYILDPIGGWIWDRIPDFVIRIKDALAGNADNKDNPFAFSSSKKIQAKDGNGNLLYTDTNGNQTTQAGGYDANGNWVDYTPAYTGTTEYTYGDSTLARALAHTNAESQLRGEKDQAGRSFLLYKNDGQTGHHTIKCKDTQEYVRILGDGKIGYGFISKNGINQVSAGTGIGAIAGLLIGAGVAIASIAAAVGSGGTAAPAAVAGLKIAGSLILKSTTIMVSAAIDSALGGWVGTKIGLYVYALQDGNYACEFVTDKNSTVEAASILEMFGITDKVKDITQWPDFSKQTTGETINLKGYKNNWNPFHIITGKQYTTTGISATTNATDKNAPLLANSSTYSFTPSNRWYNGYDGFLEIDGAKYAIYDNYLANVDWLNSNYSAIDRNNPSKLAKSWAGIDAAGNLESFYKGNVKRLSDYNLTLDDLKKSKDDKKKEERQKYEETPAYEFLGFGRKGRNRGLSRHLYQNEQSLRKKRFGNSTIGDAGCGPVAATNLLNSLSGRGGALDAATAMATNYQTADGGTTPDYFEDLLNATGYGGTQTDSKGSIFDAIKNGRPTVLLGKSSRENGTPFGAGNHYINALGMDRFGNMIVEDPDLPESRTKYPAKDVMKDTITGVVSGARRGLRGGKGRFYSPKKKVRYGKARSGGDGNFQVSKMAEKAYAIIHSHEGNYESINRDDNGATSIGKIQWRANRALNLLKFIIGNMDSQKAIGILGQNLYNEINNATSWKGHVISKDQVDPISKLISTDEGKTCQDYQALKDIDDYFAAGRKKGLTDEGALIFWADMYNQRPASAYDVVNWCRDNLGKSIGQLTAADLFEGVRNNSVFGKPQSRLNRYADDLAKTTGTQPVGTGNTTLNFDSLHTDVETASGDMSEIVSNDGSLLNILTSAFYDSMRGLYGDGIMNLLGTGMNAASSSTTYEQYPTNYGGVTGSGFVQPAEVANGPLDKNNTPAYRAALVEKMKSKSIPPDYKKGTVAYTHDWDKQDPDKGYGSCASTVAWAYKKATGYKPGGASAANVNTLAADPNLVTVWKRDGAGNFTGENTLKTGDILFYDWNKTGAYKDGDHLAHAEMLGETPNQIWNNGGGVGTYGPYLRDWDGWKENGLIKRRANLMTVKRLNTFWNYDYYGPSNGGKTSEIPDYLKNPNADTTPKPVSISDFKAPSLQDIVKNASGGSRKGVRKARKSGMARIKTSASTQDIIKRYGNTSARSLVSSAGMASANSDLEYAQFLTLIIDLLASIADNTSTLHALQQTLASRGINMSTEDLQKAAGNARKKQPSGKSRSLTNRTPSNSFIDPTNLSDFMQSPTGYIVRAMELLAQE